MLREVLKIGDKIDLKLLDRNGKPSQNGKVMASKLIDFADMDVIYITTPIVNGRTVTLVPSEHYHVCFYTDKGLYQCKCVILSSYREGNTYLSVIRITTNLEKYQRRQYFRLECILDFEYRVITEEEELLDSKYSRNDFVDEEELEKCKIRLSQLNKERIKGSITDLSGGGAKFTSDRLHSAGDKLRIWLDLITGSDVKTIEVDSNVIFSSRIVNRRDIFEHRVEYTNITPRDREELIKYIFEQERKRRRYDKN